ncbi:MAG: TonB-dependent receptor [Chitinophagaceae bacterium]|jgi:hypothetical protein
MNLINNYRPLFFTLLLVSCFSYQSANAQTHQVSGLFSDSSDKEPILGVSVILSNTTDTSVKFGTGSDFDGSFLIENVPNGNYNLRATYLGYSVFRKSVTVNNDNVALGDLNLSRTSTSLNTVVVAGTLARSQQSGDTTSFNAGAYKTNPDATAEDLLNKMPGVSTSDGTLKVNGEQVKKIFIDGKEFFGDDPNAAIKNLPSEIIEKIQVYDRASDQSQFTGFDDGNSEKSINIQTKKGMNNGMFGKVSGGYGADESSKDSRYTFGGNLNYFNGDRRISIVGLANNINQQNFSADDLLGVSSSSSSGNRGRGGARGGRGGGGDDASSNFMVNNQGGITQTQSGGLNYSDNWSKKLKVTGSYFFNKAENTNQTDLSRTYTLQNKDSSLVYNENNLSESTNTNHRVNFRAEWNIDSNNAIFITPKITYQQNETQKNLTGSNLINGGLEGSSLSNKTFNNSEGYNFSNSLLYRHKFRKQGRTISANFDTRINSRTGDGSLYSLNDYVDTSILTDQKYNLNSEGTTLGVNIQYTEPLSKKMQLQLSYNPSFNHNESGRNTFNKVSGGDYTNLDSTLSNQFSNDYSYQKGGAGIRYNTEKVSFNTAVNAQSGNLKGTQIFPQNLEINRTFTNVLPQAMMNIKFTKTENLRLFYRTNTNAPSISQLQNVIDNSNPLQLRMGNPNLQQDYTHSVNLRYGKTMAGKGNGIFLFANATFTNNYIGNSTIVEGDGVQITMPVNLDGYMRTNAFATYSLPVKKLKSNLNFSAGINYSKTPSLINNIANNNKNYAVNGGLVIGSNISENIDFTVSYSGAYNIAHNTAQPQSDFKYYSQTSSLKFNWIFLKGFVFNTNLNHTLYSGLGEGFNQNYLLWNASLGYKFLKNKSLQADIYAFDILNQNNSISRTINDYYVEDTRTTVLQRYLMLKLTYTLRAFKSAKDDKPADFGNPGGSGGGDGRRMGRPEGGQF